MAKKNRRCVVPLTCFRSPESPISSGARPRTKWSHFCFSLWISLWEKEKTLPTDYFGLKDLFRGLKRGSSSMETRPTFSLSRTVANFQLRLNFLILPVFQRLLFAFSFLIGLLDTLSFCEVLKGSRIVVKEQLHLERKVFH